MLSGRVRLFLLVLCLATPFDVVFAQSPDELFRSGVDAANAGEYQRALEFFLQARRAGMDTAVLKYNLAVAYYRTAQYEQARLIYIELSNEPSLEQLAYFNLGLIANKQKDPAAATGWFRRAYRYIGDDRPARRIRSLSATALERLGASPVRSSGARDGKRAWRTSLSTSLARDSNVTLVNDELAGVTRQSDTYVDFAANGGRWLKGRDGQGVRLRLGALLQAYSSLGENDFSLLQVGLARHDLLGEWKMRFATGWDEIYFSGQEYQRVISAGARARYDLSAGRQLRLGYRLDRIQATSASYFYLDGWRQQLRAALRQRDGDTTLRAYYQLEVNDRVDRVGLNNTFSSYSPMRHSLRLTGWWRFGDGWRLRLDGRYRYSLYGGPNVLSDGSRVRRQDRQVRVSAQLDWRVARHWGVLAGYYFTTNSSNIDRRGYDRSLFKLGLSWRN